MTTSERPIESLDAEMVRVLAAKSGAERLAIAAGMFRAARRMIASHLRAENPLRNLQAVREGGSEHLRDVAGVLAISGSVLDREYLEGWADRLGVSPTWRRVLASRPAGS